MSRLAHHAERLKQKREAAGISIESLAQTLGVSVWTIRNWENANPERNREPSYHHLRQMVEMYRCTADEIIGIRHSEQRDLSSLMTVYPVEVDGERLTEAEKEIVLNLARSLIQNRQKS
ncbi:helix-turn-helix domain-containing protein [Heliobacterium gestii]|uniref:Helix-turn-helix domain-containing protein n=1 Tax=Heliomicrobium gestii TaxID=2699 RepID=A0A845LII1_HELGE|nr:helix-turn-helix transcriptional regulator [Heliomicrobium gestii]MBM7866002.1 transcriptional regulator with XRE-family HTH domain [Heliomicrobium gestii]MZP42666.1 helix-turn-helix domain-containing protein [Heliomicrobium gestii]